jgi:hypothetical protein
VQALHHQLPLLLSIMRIARAALIACCNAVRACLQALLHQLPLLLSNISSVWLELEASGADNPSTERGEMLYGGGLWSGSSSSSSLVLGLGYGDEDVTLGQSLVESEEAGGEAERRQAVSCF